MTTIAGLMLRSLVFGMLWLVLAGGMTREPVLVVVIIAASVAASWVWWKPGSVRIGPLALLAFVPRFLWQSVLGGWDVARRALLPGRHVDPGFVTVDLRRGSYASRVLFTWIVSLVPGTVSTRLDGRRLRVHVLDRTSDNLSRLERLEARTRRIVAPDIDAGPEDPVTSES
jgi:multicomponent Na+:H+ antiporter subunit E